MPLLNNNAKILIFYWKAYVNLYNRERNRIGKIWAKCHGGPTEKEKNKTKNSNHTGCESLARKKEKGGEEREWLAFRVGQCTHFLCSIKSVDV